MKLIDKIHSLLQSTNRNDILIAIGISYQLPFEEFDALFDNYIRPKVEPKGLYYFIRNNKIYFWGMYLGRTSNDLNSLEEVSSRYDVTKYTNLTPDL